MFRLEAIAWPVHCTHCDRGQAEGFEPQWLLEQRLAEAQLDLKLKELVNTKVAELCRVQSNAALN